MPLNEQIVTDDDVAVGTPASAAEIGLEKIADVTVLRNENHIENLGRRGAKVLIDGLANDVETGRNPGMRYSPSSLVTPR